MINGQHIILRALEKNDLEFLYQLENNMDYWHLGSVVTSFSRNVLEQYLENAHLDIYTAKQFRFIIEFEENPIGTIDLYDFDPINQRAGVGIIILEEYRQKRLASEALELLTNYCKNMLQLHQLYADILIDNISSIKLFEKAGFIKTGEKTDWIRLNGLFHNIYNYQLIL